MRTNHILAFTLAGALLAGCRAPAPASTAELHVLAAETFLADIAQNVAGRRVVVESLLPPGVDPHGFQAAPQDAIRIAQAQVLIVNGLGYETWLENSLAADPPGRLVVKASEGVIPAVAGDPHQWMNPLHVVRYAENIRDALTQADPDGRSTYSANTDAFVAQLRTLDEWIRAQVSALPPERRVLVTNHHALESFAAAYGFEVAGVVIPGLSSEAAPSARQMAALIETIRSAKAPAIFLDVSENQNLARQIAAESGARVVTGLYVETLSTADGPAPTYIDMLKYDVGLIVEALK